MVQFPQYESYKDSGVEWIGQIPDTWKVLPLTKYTKSLVDYRGKTPTKVDFGIFLVTAKNIKNGIIDYRLSQEYIAENQYTQVMSRGRPQIDDLLFTTEAPLGEVALIDKTEIALAQRIIKFRLDKQYLLPKFTKYSIISRYFQNYLQSEATGSTAQGIKSSKLHKLKIISPPLEEQKKIVDFLDKKTAEIDKAIAQKQKLIELLQEQKAILINRAVTKGLNPNVTMRDSGIEWIGDIPEHWEVKKIKYLVSRIDYGLSESAKSEGEYKYLNMGHIQNGEVLLEKTGYLDNVPNSLLLEHHDILFNRTNSFELVGKSGIYNGSFSEKVTFASYLVRLRTNNKANPIWLNGILNDNCFLESIRSLALRSLNQANLNPTRLSQVFVPVPPVHEQSNIADALIKIKNSFENQINYADKSINLYLELKQILISNAVTGKIKI